MAKVPTHIGNVCESNRRRKKNMTGPLIALQSFSRQMNLFFGPSEIKNKINFQKANNTLCCDADALGLAFDVTFVSRTISVWQF